MSDKDTIYRQDVCDWLNEMEKYGRKEDAHGYHNACAYIAQLPSAEKAQLSGEDATFDCISRQAAIGALKADPMGGLNYESILGSLPSAEPRKKGKWIYGEKSGQDGWYCSECGGFIPWYYDFYGLDNIDFIEDFKTCPFCDSKMVSYTGADMREGEEE